jgi:hypothetical protein
VLDFGAESTPELKLDQRHPDVHRRDDRDTKASGVR